MHISLFIVPYSIATVILAVFDWRRTVDDNSLLPLHFIFLIPIVAELFITIMMPLYRETRGGLHRIIPTSSGRHRTSGSGSGGTSGIRSPYHHPALPSMPGDPYANVVHYPTLPNIISNQRLYELLLAHARHHLCVETVTFLHDAAWVLSGESEAYTAVTAAGGGPLLPPFPSAVINNPNNNNNNEIAVNITTLPPGAPMVAAAALSSATGTVPVIGGNGNNDDRKSVMSRISTTRGNRRSIQQPIFVFDGSEVERYQFLALEALAKKFIHEDAPYQINISAQLRKEIQASITLGNTSASSLFMCTHFNHACIGWNGVGWDGFPI
jgi:hypothetical protein